MGRFRSLLSPRHFHGNLGMERDTREATAKTEVGKWRDGGWGSLVVGEMALWRADYPGRDQAGADGSQ